MRLPWYNLVLLGLFISGMVITVAPVSAITVTIDNTPGAIAAALADPSVDTIILNPGTFAENNLVIPRDIIIRANTAAGGSATDTIIDAQSAGRIFNNTGGHALTIDNLTLQNGRITANSGGAILQGGGILTITHAAFSNCSADDAGIGGGYGGAIVAAGIPTIIIDSTTFTGCTATAMAGAIAQLAGTLTISGSTFSGCTAAAGGAILSTTNTSITHSVFTGCRATLTTSDGSGGAILIGNIDTPITSTISDSLFSDCTAAGDSGGAVYSTGQSTLRISGISTFSSCTAASDGGAISHNGVGTVDINGATFTGCSASNGGAIGAEGSGSVSVTGSEFSGCTAEGSNADGYGGAIFSHSAATTITVDTSVFSSCSADQHGGATLSYGPVTITGSTFENCRGTDAGAVYFAGDNDTVTSSVFANCTATGDGGAIFSNGRNVTITSSTLTGNTATHGGTISIGSGTTSVRFSRIFNNTANAVHSWTGTINARNNWWGSNANPSGLVTGAVDVTSWLLLGITATPDSITNLETSAIGTNMTFNNAGTDTSVDGIFVPDGITNRYAVVSGSGSVSPLTVGTVNGIAGTTFTPLFGETVNISGTVDDQTVYIELPVAQTGPVPTGITPNTGVNTSGIAITNLAGSSFTIYGPTAVYLTRVGYDRIPATSASVVDNTRITCMLPITGAEAGVWDVMVINPDGLEGVLPGGFTITAPAPAVTAITPATGLNTSSVSITGISGTYFQDGAAVVLMRAGHANITATGVSTISASQITCTIPITGAEAGPWNVVVTNPDGQVGVLVNGFTILAPNVIPPPAVTAITPNTGINKTSVRITNLAGSNFNTTFTPGVKLNRTGYADIVATGVATPASSRITCTFPIVHRPAGTWNLIVTNPDGQEAILANGFTITAPAPTTVPTTTSPATTTTFPSEPGSSDDNPRAIIPLMTVTVNIGGDSQAWQAIVNGTKLIDLIITGTVQPGPGTSPAAPPGIVYQYISLVPARYSSITNAVINFTVPRSWLDEHHIDPKSIVLYHQTANGWVPLPTTLLFTKDGTVSFSAVSPGFSLFAIAGTPATATPDATVKTPAVLNSPVQEKTPLAASTTRVPVTTPTTAPPATAPLPSAPSPLTDIVLVIAAIGILAGGGFMIRRWGVRRQNPALFPEYK